MSMKVVDFRRSEQPDYADCLTVVVVRFRLRLTESQYPYRDYHNGSQRDCGDTPEHGASFLGSNSISETCG